MAAFSVDAGFMAMLAEVGVAAPPEVRLHQGLVDVAARPSHEGCARDLETSSAERGDLSTSHRMDTIDGDPALLLAVKLTNPISKHDLDVRVHHNGRFSTPRPLKSSDAPPGAPLPTQVAAAHGSKLVRKSVSEIACELLHERRAGMHATGLATPVADGGNTRDVALCEATETESHPSHHFAVTRGWAALSVFLYLWPRAWAAAYEAFAPTQAVLKALPMLCLRIYTLVMPEIWCWPLPDRLDPDIRTASEAPDHSHVSWSHVRDPIIPGEILAGTEGRAASQWLCVLACCMALAMFCHRKRPPEQTR